MDCLNCSATKVGNAFIHLVFQLLKISSNWYRFKKLLLKQEFWHMAGFLSIITDNLIHSNNCINHTNLSSRRKCMAIIDKLHERKRGVWLAERQGFKKSRRYLHFYMGNVELRICKHGLWLAKGLLFYILLIGTARSPSQTWIKFIVGP